MTGSTREFIIRMTGEFIIRMMRIIIIIILYIMYACTKKTETRPAYLLE